MASSGAVTILNNPKRKLWFLGIGISVYENFPTLPNAAKDVSDILQLFKNKYGITKKNSITIFDRKATRHSIITILDGLKKKVEADDNLIIYYAGHGHLDSDKKGYWIPFDAQGENTANYIRNSTIRDYIEVLNSHHTFLISDSCFSGSLFVRGTVRSLVNEDLDSLQSRWALCSGRHDQQVFDGNPGDNSPFCSSIMKVLKRNKTDLNVSNLINSVVDLTRFQYHQLPEGNPLHGVGHEGGQMIFRPAVEKSIESKDDSPQVIDEPKDDAIQVLDELKEESRQIEIESNVVKESLTAETFSLGKVATFMVSWGIHMKTLVVLWLFPLINKIITGKSSLYDLTLINPFGYLLLFIAILFIYRSRFVKPYSEKTFVYFMILFWVANIFLIKFGFYITRAIYWGDQLDIDLNILYLTFYPEYLYSLIILFVYWLFLRHSSSLLKKNIYATSKWLIYHKVFIWFIKILIILTILNITQYVHFP